MCGCGTRVLVNSDYFISLGFWAAPERLLFWKDKHKPPNTGSAARMYMVL